MDLVWIEIRRDSCTIGIGFTIDDLPFGVWWAMGMKFTVSMRFGGQMVGASGCPVDEWRETNNHDLITRFKVDYEQEVDQRNDHDHETGREHVIDPAVRYLVRPVKVGDSTLNTTCWLGATAGSDERLAPLPRQPRVRPKSWPVGHLIFEMSTSICIM